MLARDGSIRKFIEPELSFGVSRQNIKSKIKWWVDNQHLAMWHSPCSTHRQVQKLILDLSPATKAWLLSFNRTQSRVVTGLLTRHNILSYNPTCRKSATEEKNHSLCVCEALASLRLACLCSFLWILRILWI